MDKATKKKIQSAFFNYKKSDKLVQSTVEWAEKNMAVQFDKIAVKSSGGSKEDELCGIIDKQDNTLRWWTVVQKVLDHYKWDCKEWLIKYKYFKRWSNAKICNELHISDRTFRYWNEEILMKAEMWAKEYKLL